MKKTISIVISALMAISLISCGSTENKTVDKSSSTASKDKYANLEGDWNVDLTSDDFNAKYTKLLKNVEDKATSLSYKYEEKEVVKEYNDKYIYFENNKAEKDQLQSLRFERKIFGEDLASGQIEMKISYNFDGQKAMSNFNFADTSIAKFGAIFTGKSDRDYSEINAKIKETLNSKSGEGIIKSQVNGLYEELTVNKEYIIYTLETKEYEFVKPNQ